MNHIAVVVCLYGLLATVARGQNKPEEKKNPAQKQDKKADVVFKTTKEKFSYARGLTFGRSLKRNGVELNVKAVVQGLIDGLNKAEPKLSAKELSEAIIAYFGHPVSKAYLENIKKVARRF